MARGDGRLVTGCRAPGRRFVSPPRGSAAEARSRQGPRHPRVREVGFTRSTQGLLADGGPGTPRGVKAIFIATDGRVDHVRGRRLRINGGCPRQERAGRCCAARAIRGGITGPVAAVILGTVLTKHGRPRTGSGLGDRRANHALAGQAPSFTGPDGSAPAGGRLDAASPIAARGPALQAEQGSCLLCVIGARRRERQPGAIGVASSAKVINRARAGGLGGRCAGPGTTPAAGGGSPGMDGRANPPGAKRSARPFEGDGNGLAISTTRAPNDAAPETHRLVSRAQGDAGTLGPASVEVCTPSCAGTDGREPGRSNAL